MATSKEPRVSGARGAKKATPAKASPAKQPAKKPAKAKPAKAKPAKATSTKAKSTKAKPAKKPAKATPVKQPAKKPTKAKPAKAKSTKATPQKKPTKAKPTSASTNARAAPAAPSPAPSPLPPVVGVSSPPTARARLLVDGARFGAATLAMQPLPALRLASGVIVACDPFEVTGPAFARRVAAGDHPVFAAVATYPRKRGPGEQRLAAVIVRFSDSEPSRWEPAAFVDDPAAPDPAYISATGAGCFMDVRLQAQLAAEPSSWPTASYRALERQLLVEHHASTWGWATYQPVAESPDNCLAFLSVGGAVRRSYWGLDDRDQVACLLTDLEAFPAEAWTT